MAIWPFYALFFVVALCFLVLESISKMCINVAMKKILIIFYPEETICDDDGQLVATPIFSASYLTGVI